MKVVLLAGGLGTRLSEETVVKPKPMVEIGGKPLLWHIMSGYATHGFKEFMVALGYKGEMVKEYFIDLYYHSSDITVNLKCGEVKPWKTNANDWIVHLIDTGANSMTGGRLYALRDHLRSEAFMLTYGDGVSNVNISKLLAFHRAHGKTATITGVRPPARFGAIETDGDRVVEFKEKPQLGEGWINGGFFVFEPAFLNYLDGDQCVLEGQPMEQLARDGELMMYRHEQFWQCMDTLRDKHYLERLWESGDPPWKTW